MFRKIVVGYDDSDQARDAATLGKQIAETTGAELVLAGVSQFDPVWQDWDPHLRDANEELAGKLRAAGAATGAQTEHVPSSSPARGLHELAENLAADLIVVGSSRHGRVGQVLAGTTGVALLHGAPCAIGVAPHGYREHAGDTIGRVAVAFDGSDESGEALIAASRLAADAHAKLSLVSAAVPPPMAVGRGGMTGWQSLLDAIEEETRMRLAQARDSVPEGIDVDTTMMSGDPVEALTKAGDSAGTIMVIGSRAYGPLRRVLLGSVSARLVRSAPCPVIVTARGMRHTADPTPASALGAAS